MSAHRLEATADGSLTLFHAEYNEQTHTRDGAYTEALYKHVDASQVLSRRSECVRVLDVGFGLGYNILALLERAKSSNFPRKLEIHSLEKDRDILLHLKKLSFDKQKASLFDKIIKSFAEGSYTDSKLSITLHFGDARKSVQKLLEGNILFDAVFHDPHSPGKNSELWTVEFFRVLYKMMQPDAILTTYSFAYQVRQAMVEAGLHIAPNKGEHIIKEGTLASKVISRLHAPFEQAYLDFLENEVKATPYHDNATLTLPRETIFEDRIHKMRLRREKNAKLDKLV